MSRTFRIIALLIITFTLLSSAIAGATSAQPPKDDYWTTKSPMNQARIGLGAAAVNGKIYAIGGNSGHGSTDVNEEYNPATDTWTYKTPMPTPRYAFGIAVYQNKIYCIGGKPSDTANNPNVPAVSVNEAYDPATDTWQTLAPMPTARMDLQANIVDGKIYACGGRASDRNYDIAFFDANEVYDPLSNSWTIKAPMLQAAAVWTSAVVNNKIYIIIPTLNMIYDPQKDNWTQRSPPPNGYAAVGGATSGTFAPVRIYTFSSTKTLSYDPRTDSWDTNVSKSALNDYAGLAILDDRFYLIGGWTLDYSNYHPSSQFPLYFQPQEVYTGVNERYTPIGYGTPDPSVTKPEIIIQTPESITYNATSVPLDFTVNKLTDWLGFSLDCQENVTITGNTTLANLPSGQHNVTVYANDTYGNTAASETTIFTVDEPASFPTTEAAAATAAILGVAGGLVYFMKRRQIRIIEEKGELKTTLTTWVWAIGLAFVLAGLGLLGFSILNSLNALNYFSTIIWSFVFTYSAVFLATEMYVIRKWQRETHREILIDSSWIVGRMYASSPVENPTKS